jgi:hypothetical protein
MRPQRPPRPSGGQALADASAFTGPNPVKFPMHCSKPTAPLVYSWCRRKHHVFSAWAVPKSCGMDSTEPQNLRFPTTVLAGQDFVTCRSTNFRPVPAGGGCAGVRSRQTDAPLPSQMAESNQAVLASAS